MSTTRGALRIGVDLGGTKTEAVVVDVSGDSPKVIERVRRSTPKDDGYDAIVASTGALIRDVAERASVSVADVGIGVGMPGGVERRTGLVKNSNTVCLNGRPFRGDLERTLGRSIAFENDANCFALAEATFGGAREHRGGIVFGVIMGTGVGGGVVVNGRVHAGPHGIAGEWGHHAVWSGRPDARACYCGQRGCVEVYASGPAVEADYLARSGERRSLAEIAAATDDPFAKAALDELLETFGRGLANVIDVLDPDAIVIGGGVSNVDALYVEGRARVAKYVFNDELLTPIEKHALGDSAGVLGAALLG